MEKLKIEEIKNVGKIKINIAIFRYTSSFFSQQLLWYAGLVHISYFFPLFFSKLSSFLPFFGLQVFSDP